MPTRPRHGWPFYFAVAVIAVVLYAGSFGPACWLIARRSAKYLSTGPMIAARKSTECWPFKAAYWPIGWMAQNGPEPVQRAITWYATIRVDGVYVPTNPAGTDEVFLTRTYLYLF